MKQTVPHYLRVARLIKKRIVHGDYRIQPLPSERQLAREFEVNYMTVRRGLQLLIKEGLLERQPNGRIQVRNGGDARNLGARVALLVPMLMSSRVEEWRVAVEACTLSRQMALRTVLYVHWDDPVVVDAVRGFDGVFIIPAAEDAPGEVLKFLQNPAHRVVMLDQNFTGHGLPSVMQFPALFVQNVLDHLASLGKTRIGCFNTQPEHEPVLERMDQWRFWMAAHGFRGELYSRPVESGRLASVHAYHYMNEILRSEGLRADALFCITAAAAMGVLRALADVGREAGRDLPVAAANGEGIAELFNPTLTSLTSPDMTPYLDYCLDWMLSEGKPWVGPLLMAPAQIPLYVGESTTGRNVRS
jgi:DNA-binding transcriptional regulator YhcF (GntR family)